MKRGLIQVYTGDGKGKTTASVGLAVRCVGHGLRVCFITFHKNPERWGYGELEVMRRIGVDVFTFAERHPSFDEVGREELRNECLKGLEFAREAMGRYDVVILDEVNVSLRDGFLKEEEVVSLMEEKPEGTELVLTGRGAAGRILEMADLVSEIRNLKHPYSRGIPPRRGVEF